MKNPIRKFIMRLRGEPDLDRLRAAGLRVGKNFSMGQECILDVSHCWLIEIGDNVTLAPRVHILAHDASMKRALNYARIGRVTIGCNTFIGAGAILLPNIRIGSNCIVGAGSVVTRDLPDGSVAAGNPARVLCATAAYLEKQKEQMKTRPVYGEELTTRQNISAERKQEMLRALEDGIGFVE